jgi:DNA-binding SARP family transcriptional activator
MIRVRILGAVELQVGHRRIGMNTEVLFALALYLTTRAGERIPRDELLTLFWGKGSDEKQRHALRQMLYRLRQKGVPLEEAGDRVTVDPALVDSDVRYALDAAWVEKAAAAEIDAAGSFVLAFSRRLTPEFLTWVEEIRDRVGAQHRKASLRQITVARREGRWADLERWAQSVLRTDPLNEDATLARAESAAMAGSKTQALEILDDYLAEVGDISPDLGKPVQALRKRLAERRPDWTLRGPKEVALVGRTELMTRLTGLVEAAWRGEGSAVVLTGPAGIGKTRLALETRAYAELKGMRTVVVRAEVGQVERPLGVVLSLIPLLIALPGAAGSDPAALELLTQLVKRTGHTPTEPSLSHDPMRESILAALDDVFGAVAAECRLLVLVDDAHHVDAESVPLLSRLAVRTAGRRVAWLATSRNSITSRSTRTGALTDFIAYRVPPLEGHEARALVSSVLEAHQLSLPRESISEIVRRSGGNPLFVREIGAHRAISGRTEGMPSTLTSLISDRLGRLDAGTVRMLRVIALLGGGATISRVATLTAQAVPATAGAIELLEGDGLISMSDTRIVLHESWHLAIKDGLRGATLAAIAFECAELLRDTRSSPSSDDTWRAAELYAIAGEGALAHRCFLEAADEMLRIGLPDEAVTILNRALTVPAGTELRLSIKRRLAEAHHTRGDLANVLLVSEDVHWDRSIARTAQAMVDLTVTVCHRADALAKSHLPLARELRFLRDAAADPNTPLSARHFACYAGIRRAIFAENRGLARTFFELAETSTPSGLSSIPAQLVRLIYAAEFSESAEVAVANEALARVPSDSASLTLRCNALRFRAYALRMGGFLSESKELGLEAFEISQRFRQREIAANTAEMMTFLALDLEEIDQAEHWIAVWRGIDGLPTHPMRDKGLRHAEARLALQQRDYERVWSLLAPAAECLRGDPVVSRRAGELLTLALAASRTGRVERARSELQPVLADLRVAGAEFLLDYPNEMCARVLRDIGEEARALDHAANYVKERASLFRRPLPPFYKELAPAWNAVTSALGTRGAA